MAFTPRKGYCQICGKEMMINSAIHKYCPECRKMVRNTTSKEHRRIEMARRIAIQRGTDPDRYKGLEHECLVKDKCVYGSKDCCMYLAIEEHSRLLAGHPIRGGRCDLYKRGKKKQAKPGLPKSSPVMRIGKVREI